MTKVRSVAKAATSIFFAVLSGCSDVGTFKTNLETGSLGLSGDEHPQDQPVALGKLHYEKGDYGLAEENFRAAVEANPKSSEAWLGLAAAYDKLGRFDLADHAYDEVLRREGRSAPVLNNLGYHNMLKGDLRQARALLMEAAEKDPTNPSIQGNLHLLETWKSGA